MKRNFPIPTQIDLGFTLLHIKQVTKKEMEREIDDWEAKDEFELPKGLWDPAEDTIYIGKWLKMKDKRWVLLHELQHAALDLRDML
jgi:Zn-dependent peptidase ImmA (M78 family)